MYLYINANKTTDDLPDELLKLVKQLTHVMELDLTKTEKLARVNIKEVIQALEKQDYFLQMPPKDMQVNMHYGD